MVRIGRQIPHFDEVKQDSLEAVFSRDHRFRYILSMQFRKGLFQENRSKSISVILKNPSAADHRAADATIRKVETFIFHHFDDVGTLHILNIFALRATDAIEINDVYRDTGKDGVVGDSNDKVISECIGESDYLVAAWGNNSGIDGALYEERIEEVKRIIQKFSHHRIFRVKGEKDTVQPLHGLMWGYNYEVVPYLI